MSIGIPGSNPAHIAVSANNIFVVWSNAFGSFTEIWFTRSTDGGNTFETAERLSNSLGVESRVGPGNAVAANGNNVYVVWYEEEEILYRQSFDVGSTFGDIVNISNTPGGSFNPSLAAAENSIYVVWTEGPNNEITYRASILPFGVDSSLIDLTNGVGNSGPAAIAVSS